MLIQNDGKMNRFFVILFLISNYLFAQLENNILFKVNDSLVYVDEFNRVYNKNIDLIDENNQKDFEYRIFEKT